MRPKQFYFYNFEGETFKRFTIIYIKLKDSKKQIISNLIWQKNISPNFYFFSKWMKWYNIWFYTNYYRKYLIFQVFNFCVEAKMIKRNYLKQFSNSVVYNYTKKNFSYISSNSITLTINCESYVYTKSTIFMLLCNHLCIVVKYIYLINQKRY